MTRISVIVISFNEGDWLRRTIDHLLPTLPPESEVIVVDDQSTDNSTAFLDDRYPTVKLFRSDQRLGVAPARNFGAAQATGDILVFSDAHVIVPSGWLAPLLELLTRPEIGAVAPAIAGGAATGYGQKWTDASLAIEWLGKQGDMPYPVPLLCGCFLALRQELFTQIGQFDPGMVLWGAEDSEISLRLWLAGHECWVVPNVEIQHRFHAQFPYEVKWEPVLHNRLRLAALHFGPRRLERVIARLKPYHEFAAASARLLSGDLPERAAQLRPLRAHDHDWFFDRFPTLQSELTFTRRHSPSVTACLVSWKRPQNLGPIIESMRAASCIDEILIWNNNPEVSLAFDDPNVRVIPSEQNQSCYGRFLCAAHARNPVIYVQDDDAVNHDIDGLYERYLLDPQRIAHALASTHWNQRNRRVYGDSQAALVGWGAFFRKEWLTALDNVPEDLRQDPLFLREADAFFSLLLDRKHNPVEGRISHLDGHSTPGIALWRDPRHQQQTAIAISRALALIRRRKGLPLQWNVVIPCRNYARFLADAIESVLASDADYEITIVDDASEDHTADVASQYPQVRYLRNERRRGPGYSRNRGIEAAPSEYIVLLDADDRLGPDYLFHAAKMLAAGCDIVNPDAVLFGATSDRWIVPESTTLAMLLERNSVHYCSAFRRDLWLKSGGIDETMPCWMDYEFWIRLAAAGARIKGLHGDHFFYRQHGANLSETANGMKAELRAYLRKKHASLYSR